MAPPQEEKTKGFYLIQLYHSIIEYVKIDG